MPAVLTALRVVRALKPAYVVLAVAVMACAALGAYVLARAYEHQEQAAFATADNLTRVIAERLEATLRRADNDLRLFVRFLPRDAMQRAAADRYRANFEAQFRAKLEQFPEILSRNVVDAGGNSLYRVGTVSAARANYADREWFKALRDNPQLDAVISDVISARVSGTPTIVLARAVRNRDGRFLGSANATIDLDQLERMLRSLDIGENGRIVVRKTGGDNKLVMRHPPEVGAFNSTVNTETNARIRAGETYGRFKTVSPLDGMELATTFRVLDDFPFSISVGLAKQDYLREWRRMALISGVAGLAFVTLLLLLVLHRISNETRLARLAAKLKLSEVALQASNQFLRDVLESGSDGILVEDTTGLVLATNRRFHSMWQVPDVIAGLADRNLLSRHMAMQLVNPAELPTRADMTGGSDVVHFRPLELRDGRQIEPDAAALQRDGEPAGRVWSFHDVTDRQRVQRMYGSIIESSADAFVAFDEQLRITSWSPRAESVFGAAAADMIARPLANVLPDADAAGGIVQKLLAAVRAGNTDATRRVSRLLARRIDTHEFPAEIQISGFKMGETWEYTSFIRDISTRLLAEEHLAQVQKFEAIGQLTGGLAHDFNNILGIIIGSLDLMEAETADNLELRNAALAAARRGSDVTKSLLSVARRKAVVPQSVGLDDLLHEIVPLLQQTAGRRIKLDFEAGSDGAIVQLDPGGFSSAMLNLVINARDAMPDGGEIFIGTAGAARLAGGEPAAEGDCVSVKVTDNGCGMTPAVAERAFDPFYTTKVRGKGTGLGLAMVYAFARQSGGSASITSAPGAGTTIELLLPVQSVPVRAAPAAERVQNARGCGERVLLVDDEPDLARVGRQWLTAFGYRVVVETEPQRALARLATEPFDALVSDVLMPGAIDGATLAERARRERPDLAVVLVSGYADAMTERIRGKFDLLDKPYSKQQLGAALREALDRRFASARTSAHYSEKNAA